MENNIEIKSFFGDWQKVDKEKAKRFIIHLLSGANTKNAYNYIEQHFLKGITIKELLREE